MISKTMRARVCSPGRWCVLSTGRLRDWLASTCLGVVARTSSLRQGGARPCKHVMHGKGCHKAQARHGDPTCSGWRALACQGRREKVKLGLLMKCSPVRRPCAGLELKRMRKSFGLWMWPEKSPGRSSRELSRTISTCSMDTVGLVHMIETIMACCRTLSVSSISMEPDTMTRAG